MNKYTLKPIARLLQCQPRPTYNHNDFLQLAAQWEQSKQPPALPVLKLYRAALAEVVKKCPPGKRITRGTLIDIIDQFVRERELHFTLGYNKCAYENRFMPRGSKNDSFYDLAFFHRKAPRDLEAHHLLKNALPKENLKKAVTENLMKLLKSTTPPEEIIKKTNAVIDHEVRKQAKIKPCPMYSVCYVRCEEFNKGLLIGNMQVDTRRQTKNWPATGIVKTIGRYDNIFKAMVQEAIKAALEDGREKIIFQAGYANRLTQWGSEERDFAGREIITSQNIARHQENHETWKRQVAGLVPGSIIYRPCEGVTSTPEQCVVIKSTAARIHFYRARYNALLPLVYNTTYWEGFRSGRAPDQTTADRVLTIPMFDRSEYTGLVDPLCRFKQEKDCRAGYYYDCGTLHDQILGYKAWETKTTAQISASERHLKCYRELISAYVAKDAARLLTGIDTVFDYLVEIDFTAQRDEKIDYLKNLFNAAPKNPAELKKRATLCTRLAHIPNPWFQEDRLRPAQPAPPPPLPKLPVYKIIEQFLYHFNYHKLLLEKIPNLKMVIREDQQPEIYHQQHDLCFIDITPPPTLGGLAPATYKYPADVAPIYPVRPVGRIYKWYENDLRRIFKELKLDVKRTYITSEKAPEKYATAYGWEIITPKEELRARQIICV